MQGLESAQAAGKVWAREKDRESYRWVFEAVERAISGHLVTGKAAICALTSSPLDLADWYYSIIIRGGDSDAVAIHDAVCAARSSSDPVVTLRTSIDNREYSIEVDGRTVVRIWSAGRHGDTEIIDTMTKVEGVSPITGNKIAVVGAEIALLDTTRALYTPHLAGTWDAEYANYVSLIGLFIKSSGDILGGASRKPKRAKIEIDLPDGCTWIGERALEKLGIVQRTDRHRQCISALPIAEVAKRVGARVGRAVRVVKYFVGLPGDFQLTKHTIYTILGDGGQRPVLDVYNTTSYELIPLAKKGVAGMFVIMRFLLVDLWIMRVVNRVHGRGENAIRSILRSIDALAAAIRDIHHPLDLWPTDSANWIGVYTKEPPAKMRIFGMSKTQPRVCDAN